MDTFNEGIHTRRSQRRAATRKAPYTPPVASSSSNDPTSSEPNKEGSYWRRRLTRFINPWTREFNEEGGAVVQEGSTPMEEDDEKAEQDSSKLEDNTMSDTTVQADGQGTLTVPTVEITEVTEVEEITIATEVVSVEVDSVAGTPEVAEVADTPEITAATPEVIGTPEIIETSYDSETLTTTEPATKKKRAKRSPVPSSTRTTRRTRRRATVGSEDTQDPATPSEEPLPSESQQETASETHSELLPESHPESNSEPHVQPHPESNPESQIALHSESQHEALVESLPQSSATSNQDGKLETEDPSKDEQQQDNQPEVPERLFEHTTTVTESITMVHSTISFTESHESDVELAEDDQTFHSAAQFDQGSVVEIMDDESETHRSVSIDYEETKYYPPEDDEEEGEDTVKYYPPESDEVNQDMFDQPWTPSQESQQNETSKMAIDVDIDIQPSTSSPPALMISSTESIEFSPAPSRLATREPESSTQLRKETTMDATPPNQASPSSNSPQPRDLVESDLTKEGNIAFLAAFFQKQKSKGGLLSRKQAAQLHRLINDSLIPVVDDDYEQAGASGVASSDEQADVPATTSAGGFAHIKRLRRHAAPFSVERQGDSVDDQYHESTTEAPKQDPTQSLDEYLELEKYKDVEWEKLPSYLKVRRFIHWKGIEAPSTAKKRRLEEQEEMRQRKILALAADNEGASSSTSKRNIVNSRLLSAETENTGDNLTKRDKLYTSLSADEDEESTKDRKVSNPTSVAQTLLEIAGKTTKSNEDSIPPAKPSASTSLGKSSSVTPSGFGAINSSNNAPKPASTDKPPSSLSPFGGFAAPAAGSSSPSSGFSFAQPAASGSAFSFSKPATASPFAQPAAGSAFSSSKSTTESPFAQPAAPTSAFSSSKPAVAAITAAAALGAAASTSPFSFGQPTKSNTSAPFGSPPASTFSAPPKFNFGLPSSTETGKGTNTQDLSTSGYRAPPRTFTASSEPVTILSRTPSPAGTPEPSSRATHSAFADDGYSEDGSESQVQETQSSVVEIYEDQDDEDDENYNEYEEQGDLEEEEEEEEANASWRDDEAHGGDYYSRDHSITDPDADSDKENQNPPAGWNPRPAAFGFSQPSYVASVSGDDQTPTRSPANVQSQSSTLPSGSDFDFDSKNGESAKPGELRVGRPMNPGYMCQDVWRFKGDTIDTISDYERAPLVCDDEAFYTEEGKISPMSSPVLPPRTS
ncbi:hypothetical protein BGX31_009110 [Mortierella sp. GBA43]|nr:hypothetical protein BGX31_009110 [Mortierella sp. GBA43]